MWENELKLSGKFSVFKKKEGKVRKVLVLKYQFINIYTIQMNILGLFESVEEWQLNNWNMHESMACYKCYEYIA